jgi:hypothetical protein
MPSPEIRSAVYSLATAIIALAAGYGLITEEQAALWVAAVAGAISTLLAFLNRPTS